MSELVERVARAIDTDAWSFIDSGAQWSSLYGSRDSAREASLIRARAAIEAMREPTDRMVEAADDADLDVVWGYYADGRPFGADATYRVMIDAALSEEGK